MLGIGPAEGRMLQDRLLAVALDQEATAGEADEFGDRYVIHFSLEYAGRRGVGPRCLDRACRRGFSRLDELLRFAGTLT